MLVFLKNAAAPCALFTMGVTVALRPLRRVPLEIPVLLVIKLVLHPLLVWVLLSWIGNFEREWMFTAILMAALPPALNVFVIANQYRTYVEQASTAILLGTLASVFTVTSLLLAIAHDSIPYDLFP
jgi:malonate transporter